MSALGGLGFGLPIRRLLLALVVTLLLVTTIFQLRNIVQEYSSSRGEVVLPWIKSSQVVRQGTNCTIRLPTNTSFPSILRTLCTGRIGNQLDVYATAWYFSQKYGMQPTILEEQIASIAAVFKRSKLQMDAVCKVEDKGSPLKWEPLFEVNKEGYYFYDRVTQDPEPFLKNKLLDIGMWTNALYFYKENLPELKKQFEIKDDIKQRAEHAIKTAKDRFLLLNPQAPSAIILVGIHARRTDMLECLGQRNTARYSNIDGNYYNLAMARFSSTWQTSARCSWQLQTTLSGYDRT